MKKRTIAIVSALALLLMLLPVPAAAQTPKVTITSPQKGATLPPGSVTVTVSVSDFSLKPPSSTNAPGEGHLHFYIDVEIPTTPGKGAVTAPGTYKAEPGTTMVWENVSPGMHSFGVQLVNNNHTPLEPPVTASVIVTVAEPAPEPVSTPPPPAAPTVSPKLSITSPAPNATLPPGDVTVSISVSDFTLKPPSSTVAAGEGHLHYYMDVEIPTTPGKGAVTAPGTYKADPGTTITWSNVSAGTHTFGAQLVNNNHTPLEPPITATVTVTVQAPVPPSATAPPPATPAEPAPAAPPAQTNTGLIVGLIIAAVVIILLITLWQRSRSTKKA